MTPEIPKTPEAMAVVYRVIFGVEPTEVSATRAAGPGGAFSLAGATRFVERREGDLWRWAGFDGHYNLIRNLDLFELLAALSNESDDARQAAEWGYLIGVAIAKLDAQP
jgi:hypothetical protein